MRVILNGVEVQPKQPTLTRKAWIDSLKPGRQMVCTYRWYWQEGSTREKEQMPADGRQVCTIANVRATQMNYTVPDKPGKLQWMDFPKRLRPQGHRQPASSLYFPDDSRPARSSANGPVRAGKLMSRYEWVA
jgi:hypothetical protein